MLFSLSAQALAIHRCVENNYGLNSSYKFVPRRIYIYILMQKAHMYKSWKGYRIQNTINKLEEPTDEENDILVFLSASQKRHDSDAKSLQDQSLMVCVWPFLQPQETLRLIGLFHIVEHGNLKQHNPIEMITVPLIILMDVY
ncbi:hypothetical protein F2Q68_00001458 [Brassica cretica]|uniref:Uncharacterized protein n=1 Tax=Brassica cretica TaxID=69181 RepID=A0A8S9JF62_BRACR|nr:hypothetical protein F2Q68_00001458 [Brassica cretica]